MHGALQTLGLPLPGGKGRQEEPSSFLLFGASLPPVRSPRDSRYSVGSRPVGRQSGKMHTQHRTPGYRR